jgi:hypothetical protein
MNDADDEARLLALQQRLTEIRDENAALRRQAVSPNPVASVSTTLKNIVASIQADMQEKDSMIEKQTKEIDQLKSLLQESRIKGPPMEVKLFSVSGVQMPRTNAILSKIPFEHLCNEYKCTKTISFPPEMTSGELIFHSEGFQT